jgi:hypothetical protein
MGQSDQKLDMRQQIHGQQQFAGMLDSSGGVNGPSNAMAPRAMPNQKTSIAQAAGITTQQMNHTLATEEVNM